MSRIGWSDCLIFLVVVYTYASIFLGSWDYSYALLRKCSKPIHIWLLVESGLLPVFKLVEIIFVRNAPEEIETVLFREGYKKFTIMTVGIIYPVFVICGIIGTFWYAEMKKQEVCFADEQVSWYFAMWIITFYCWIIGYTAYITYSAILHFKQIDLERQYFLLVDQYQGIEMPLMEYAPQGMSPGEISKLTIEEVPEEKDVICSVCIDKFNQGDKIRILPCKHQFHMLCIDK